MPGKKDYAVATAKMFWPMGLLLILALLGTTTEGHMSPAALVGLVVVQIGVLIYFSGYLSGQGSAQ